MQLSIYNTVIFFLRQTSFYFIVTAIWLWLSENDFFGLYLNETTLLHVDPTCSDFWVVFLTNSSKDIR